jgi:hypothetical protein
VLQGDGTAVPLTITVTATEPDRLAQLEQRVQVLEERIGPG